MRSTVLQQFIFSSKLIDAQVWDCSATYRPAGVFNAGNHGNHKFYKRVVNFLLMSVPFPEKCIHLE